MTDDQKRLDEAAARDKEARVAHLARQLFVSFESMSIETAFDQAELFESVVEERWSKLK